ncbi:MAG: hypothetical protein AB1422_18270 [bacterium]
MRRIILSAILVLVLSSFQVNASIFDENFRLEYRGELVNQTTYYQLKGDILLNPDSNLTSFPKWQNKLYKDSFISLTYKEWLKLAVKSRPAWTVNDGGNNSLKNYIDDAYVDIKFRRTFFLTIEGRTY